MPNIETKKELLEIIDKLAELEKKQNEIRDSEFEIRDRLGVIRSKYLVEISQEKDDMGKLIYPNEKVRQAAVIVALDKDTEYHSLILKLREINKTLQEVDIEVGRLSAKRMLLMMEAGITNSQSTERNRYAK